MYMLSGSVVAPICLAAPLPRLQQRRERRAVLPQIIQQLADVRVRPSQNSEAVSGADLRDDQESSFVVQYRGAERASARAQSQPIGVLRQGGGERGQRLGLERLAGGMLDRQTIGAQYQHRFNAIPINEAADDFC